jgi:hypothetical protein
MAAVNELPRGENESPARPADGPASRRCFVRGSSGSVDSPQACAWASTTEMPSSALDGLDSRDGIR